MKSPKVTEQAAPDCSVLFVSLHSADDADLMAAVEEVSRQTDAVRELTEAIEEIDSAYVPTFMSV